MKSLPLATRTKLQTIVSLLDEGLQARAHGIMTARRADRAFKRTFTAGPLQRALLCDLLGEVRMVGVRIDELGNGGCEVAVVEAGVERRFRVKLGHLDSYGRLVVTAGSDSILTPAPRTATLFDPPEFERPATFQQWVLAYLLHPQTRTFAGVTAGRIVDVVNDRPPFRLVLDDLIAFDITPPAPPSFPGSVDDLDLGGEEELGDEDAG